MHSMADMAFKNDGTSVAAVLTHFSYEIPIELKRPLKNGDRFKVRCSNVKLGHSRERNGCRSGTHSGLSDHLNI